MATKSTPPKTKIKQGIVINQHNVGKIFINTLRGLKKRPVGPHISYVMIDHKQAAVDGRKGGMKTLKTKGRKHFVNAAKARWNKDKKKKA